MVYSYADGPMQCGQGLYLRFRQQLLSEPQLAEAFWLRLGRAINNWGKYGVS
jgi:hypothetical protein